MSADVTTRHWLLRHERAIEALIKFPDRGLGATAELYRVPLEELRAWLAHFNGGVHELTRTRVEEIKGELQIITTSGTPPPPRERRIDDAPVRFRRQPAPRVDSPASAAAPTVALDRASGPDFTTVAVVTVKQRQPRGLRIRRIHRLPRLVVLEAQLRDMIARHEEDAAAHGRVISKARELLVEVKHLRKGGVL